MAPDIIPYDAWTQARQRFSEDLDEDESLIFKNATFENVFYSASTAQKSHEANSKSRAVAAKIDNLLAGINEWGKALDVYANASALFLCPLWGSIRVLIHVRIPIPISLMWPDPCLQLSSNFARFFDLVVDMLAHIGDVIPRFQIYEQLFPSHLRLTQALSNSYLDVLKFCVVVKKAFRRAKRHVCKAPLLHFLVVRRR